MKRVARHLILRLLALACVTMALVAGSATAQYNGPRFDRQALDSMLAPIALYPDALLSHVLMAATYPDEVEEAATWLRARPGLSGDAAVRTSEDQDWEPAVRSLLAFPMVLETLASHMRWTEDVGNAFLSQREEVVDTIQALRRRAYEAGTLRSNEAVRVIATGTGIVIEQASPSTVYVPHYDPRIAYGGWWWPARPPMHWPRWHGYYDPLPRGHHLTWGPGIHISSGFFFGGFVWPRREVRVVHVHPYYYPRRVVVERHVVAGRGPVVVHRDAAPGVWRHQDWRRRDRDGRDHDRRDNDRRDWRRDDDRRNPVTTRTEPREGPRTGLVSRPDRDGDGVPDRNRRVDRNNDGVPDRSGRMADPNRAATERAQRADRDVDGVPDRRNAAETRRDNRPDGRQESRTQLRDNREEARVAREAPRAAERANPQGARQSAPRESSPREREQRNVPRHGDRD
jgi:hypothetical protein